MRPRSPRSPARAAIHAHSGGWSGSRLIASASASYPRRVPESKAAKNRMYFDLRAPGMVAAEVRRHPDLTVMQDPEGNEFCVEPGPE
jgi:hypothetical protein